MRRLLLLAAPLALVACGAPEPAPSKEPPPIVEAAAREPETPPVSPGPVEPPPAQPAPSTSGAPAPPVETVVGGAPAVASPPAPSKPGSTPADTSADQATIAASNRLERERREKRVADVEAKIAELEKRRLAISNPYLPRPQLPPEEAEAWEGLDGVQRRERVDRQLEEARRELEAAKKELEALGRS